MMIYCTFLSKEHRCSTVWMIALIWCCLFLASCASSPTQDPQSSRVDVTILPKFGTDPHWGSHLISEKHTLMRTNTLRTLAESQTPPEEFSIQVTEAGWQLIGEKDYSTAMKRFNQAWLITPDRSPLAIMGMAVVVYERDSDVQGGLALMESLHEPLQDTPSYWSNYASMMKRADRPTEALEFYEKSHQLAAGNAQVMRNLIQLYAQSANFDRACEMLRQTRQYNILIQPDLLQYVVANARQDCGA